MNRIEVPLADAVPVHTSGQRWSLATDQSWHSAMERAELQSWFAQGDVSFDPAGNRPAQSGDIPDRTAVQQPAASVLSASPVFAALSLPVAIDPQSPFAFGVYGQAPEGALAVFRGSDEERQLSEPPDIHEPVQGQFQHSSDARTSPVDMSIDSLTEAMAAFGLASSDSLRKRVIHANPTDDGGMAVWIRDAGIVPARHEDIVHGVRQWAHEHGVTITEVHINGQRVYRAGSNPVRDTRVASKGS